MKYHGKPVGFLAETKEGNSAFQYDKEWLLHGFSVNPLSLSAYERQSADGRLSEESMPPVSMEMAGTRHRRTDGSRRESMPANE